MAGLSFENVLASNRLAKVRSAEPDKCDDLGWFGVDALPENTIPYVQRALDNYRRGAWFDSFGWE